MNAWIDVAGPMIWRATWQGGVLALLVALLIKCCGERLAPKWRFLLWGVVMIRLACVVTPGSSWSLFNLASWDAAAAPQVAQQDPPRVVARREMRIETPAPAAAEPQPTPHAVALPPAATEPREVAPLPSPVTVAAETPPATLFLNPSYLAGWLAPLWLLGVILSLLQLAVASLLLRRRLSACRPIDDPSLLARYAQICRQVGLRTPPPLLVTPESLSPCVVGTWAPRVILPETVVTEASRERLEHVLAHELAHLRRGDLWTNWLLLATRALHWFNPIAWWAIREMQAEREAACDEIALAALQTTDRATYADTLVELAASFSSSGIVPGMVGLFASKSRLQARVERLLRTPASPLRASIAFVILAAIGLVGLTDALPQVDAQPAAATAAGDKPEVAHDYVVRGTCVDQAGLAPLEGITVTLYQIQGQAGPAEPIATTKSDAEGKFEFAGLEPPRPDHRIDCLRYEYVATAPGWPIGQTFYDQIDGKLMPVIRMTKETTTLRGIVTDADGLPIAGATVMPYSAFDRPLPEFSSAKTDEVGAFRIDDIGVFRWADGSAIPIRVAIRHPDYPPTAGKSNGLPALILATMPDGCVVQGKVLDSVTGQPAAGVEVTASSKSFNQNPQTAVTDADGNYRMVLPEENYVFRVGAKDRVAVALGEQDCSAGKTVNLPDFVLIRGGLIAGQVINTGTGKPIAVNQQGEPLLVGLYGPAELSGEVAAPGVLATVDAEGRFQMRAAPGDNYPYVVNMNVDRMSWDTEKQPPVVVKEGETTRYDLTFTPPIPPEEKVKAAEALIASLPKDPDARAKQIVLELRKKNGGVFEDAERWTRLVSELINIGPAAVPPITAELEQTDDHHQLRKLAFALRAIGDPAAIPSLIRAISKTLQRPSSDYGVEVLDNQLNQFMRKHDLDEGNRGSDFGYGRAVRELFGTLHKLSGQDFNDEAIYSISLSEDPRRQAIQRRRYQRQAQQWQTWWEANWRTFTQDESLAKVGLPQVDAQPVEQPDQLGPSAKTGDGVIGMQLSPLTERGKYANYFIDLDTGEEPRPPQPFVTAGAALTEAEVAAWAAEQGIDLMCVSTTTADGKPLLALRAIGMQVREISPSELRNLDRILATGKLPEGRPIGDLLIHVDPETKRQDPSVDGAFLVTTKEGSLGLIETRMHGGGRSGVMMLTDPNAVPAGPGPRSVMFDMHEILP